MILGYENRAPNSIELDAKQMTFSRFIQPFLTSSGGHCQFEDNVCLTHPSLTPFPVKLRHAEASGKNIIIV